MDQNDGSPDVVDPQVRAFVYSLVSALGGASSGEDGRYVLGDEALACLRDLKRWLKLYDEKANRFDVARCLAEANLVNGDLLEILSLWPENAMEDKSKFKICLACLELLVPLTWPIEKNDSNMTVNHHRHTPYLQFSQLSYKRGIFGHESGRILRAIVRIALPSMALPFGERSSRDEGIIRLLLYFLRNIAMIAPPPNLPFEGDENEISRSATIEAFDSQDIFHLLLTICNSIGEDFNTEDIIILELLFHLLKGVNIERLFMNNTQLDTKKTDDLRSLLNKEAGMQRSHARTAPTRHNRFGTMIWIKRDDERMSAVSGQEVLLDSRRGLAKIDKTKKWKMAQRKGKMKDITINDFDMSCALTDSATRKLRNFVEDFLDSGLNPLFNHLRKAIEREAERILDHHPRQFFFLISWFLEAHRARIRFRKNDVGNGSNLEADSFALVACAFDQETFIALNRFMQTSLDNKEWQELNAGMRCFTQILHTVHDMSESSLEDDQDIAENIQNRIFYEDQTNERTAILLQSYDNQGFGYLDACTELAHVHLRMLERYSKQNTELQVRSKRRVRKKKLIENQSTEEPHASNIENINEEQAEDIADALKVSKERKFDFARFVGKFVSQGCINTFVTFTKYFEDLTPEQLKRAHRYFHRIAFKMELSVMLFRVDILALFTKMMKGPEGMDPSLPAYKEWDELVRQLIRRMTKKIEQRPQLIVEMLFSKTTSTAYFLEHGYSKVASNAKPRPPAEIEVKPGMEKADQIGVAVSVLIDQMKSDHIQWVKEVLSSAINERRSWENESTALMPSIEGGDETVGPAEPSCQAPSIIVKPDTEQRGLAMFKDNKLRLLMKLAGFERLGIEDEPGATWVIPSGITSSILQKDLDSIKKSEFSLPTYDDDKRAEDFLRRQTTKKSRTALSGNDSVSDALVDGDDDFLFPLGGPTSRKSDAIKELKKKRGSKNVVELDEDPIDTELRQNAAEARKRANDEKRRKVKSELFVHDSDDEEDAEKDAEFFRLEEERRQEQKKRVFNSLRSEDTDATNNDENILIRKRKAPEAKKPRAKRSKKITVLSNSDDDDAEMQNNDSVSSNSDGEAPACRKHDSPGLKTARKRKTMTTLAYSEDNDVEMGDDQSTAKESEDDEATDTPLSSPRLQSSQLTIEKYQKLSIQKDTPLGLETLPSGLKSNVPGDGDSDEDENSIPATVRRRTLGGFVVDSDSE
ncbi:MAG: Topoisomerase 1-associated factor 1 [Trizodia sp. TS-e1964]|nr:MAG: Topoisomerase 1-associated factor 1 [Trizodia sp. TS-e1964]